MSRIFISYRHDDSEHIAGRIHDHLSIHFGPTNVFLDAFTIQYGENFLETIYEQLKESCVFLPVIGDRWLTAKSNTGTRRLDETNDYVRLEIRLALEKEMDILPVLVDGAEHPKISQIPNDIQELALCNGIPLRGGREFYSDVRTLVEAVERVVGDIHQKGENWKDSINTISDSGLHESSYFVAHSKHFSAIAKSLESENMVAISGATPGTGKTLTALHFATNTTSSYKHKIWISADSNATVNSSFLRLGTAVGLTIDAADDDEAIQSMLFARLKNMHRAIFVFDNVTDFNTIKRQVFSLVPQHHVLITTNLTSKSGFLGGKCRELHLDALSDYEAVSLLCLRSGLIDSLEDAIDSKVFEDALIVCKRLHYLPLAIDLAGAFLASEGTDFGLSEYNEMLEAGRGLEIEQSDSPTRHPSVAATFSLQFQKLMEVDAAAADLLRICSFLSSESVSERVFISDSPLERLFVGDPYSNEANIVEIICKSHVRLCAIGSAARLGLLSRSKTPSGSILSVHKVVLQVIRSLMSTDEQVEYIGYAAALIYMQLDATDVNDVESFGKLLPHVFEISSALERLQCNLDVTAKLLGRASHFLSERGQFEEAEKLLLQAIAQSESAIGESHCETIELYCTLCEAYTESGKLPRAQECITTALGLATRCKDLTTQVQAHLAYAESRLCTHAGNFIQADLKIDEAERLYREIGAEHLAYTCKSNKGNSLLGQGRYLEAAEIFREVLEYRDTALGSRHIRYAKALMGLGDAEMNLNHFQEAILALEEAVSIMEERFGSEYLYVLVAKKRLASCLKSMGNYRDARELLEEVIATPQSALTVQNVVLADSLKDLATLLGEQKLFLEAIDTFEEMISIRTAIGDLEECVIASNAAGAILMFWGLGESSESAQKILFGKSKELYRNSVKIARGMDAPTLPVALAMRGFAGASQLLGDYEESEPLYNEALKAFGSAHEQIRSGTLMDMAKMYLDWIHADRGKRAKAVARRAARFLELELQDRDGETIEQLRKMTKRLLRK